METNNKEYENDEITVTYDPMLCHNSEKCAEGLSEVFRTSILPWIDLDGAKTSEIVSQIRKCPSGALMFCYNKELTI